MNALSVVVDVTMAFSMGIGASSLLLCMVRRTRADEDEDIPPRYTVPLQVKPPAVSGEVLSSGLLLLLH